MVLTTGQGRLLPAVEERRERGREGGREGSPEERGEIGDTAHLHSERLRRFSESHSCVLRLLSLDTYAAPPTSKFCLTQ